MVATEVEGVGVGLNDGAALEGEGAGEISAATPGAGLGTAPGAQPVHMAPSSGTVTANHRNNRSIGRPFRSALESKTHSATRRCVRVGYRTAR
jgi:hypothetical protein